MQCLIWESVKLSFSEYRLPVIPVMPISFSGHFVLQINISLNESIQSLCLVNCLPKYSACTREMNKENGWAQKLCKEGGGLNTHLSREFSGVTFRSADTLVLVRKSFLWSCSVCLFSFENVTLKTGLQNSLACHMVKR